MNIKINKKQKIGIGIFLLLLILVCSVIYFKNKSSIPDDEIKKNRVLVENIKEKEDENNIDNKKEDIESSIIKAYICGYVKNPGVYTLRKGDRLEDLVKLSGGFTSEADDKSINLASLVKDQDYFRILSKDEVVSSGVNIPNNNSSNLQNSEGEEKININTATKEELKTLPRIGDALSDRIIDHRTNKGNFKNIEDLKDVSGIGDKMLENIKDKIKVE